MSEVMRVMGEMMRASSAAGLRRCGALCAAGAVWCYRTALSLEEGQRGRDTRSAAKA